MKQQLTHNIKQKRIINATIWLGLLTYFIVSTSYASKRYDEEVCKNVNITVNDTVENLVIPRDIIVLMEQNKLSAYGMPMQSINKYHLHNLIIDNLPLVRNVNIYNAAEGTLCIDIEQRKPILRVINYNQQGFYIDAEGYIFSLSQHAAARTLVANGTIFDKPPTGEATHIDSLALRTISGRKTLQELFALATYINNDEFLQAMIEQIYVNDNEYEMIPRIGSQIIYFGTFDNFDKKFFNLKIIYHKVFSHLGWQKYKAISLKFNNQVICIKR